MASEGAQSTADALTPGEDRSTLDYFDSHLIEYTVERLDHMAALIKERAGADASLVDVGCGVGNTLAYLAEATGISNLAGIDISPRCLAETEERLGCETHCGSVLDDEFVAGIEGQFDFAVVTAVLHHLIGRSRAHSRRNAEHGLRNSVRLLKPGGHALILEPVYGPRPVTGAVFWVKKGVTAITAKRFELGSSWANVGPPVVSYLTSEQLIEMGRRAPGASLVDTHHERIDPPMPLRLALSHGETTIALKRDEARA